MRIRIFIASFVMLGTMAVAPAVAHAESAELSVQAKECIEILEEGKPLGDCNSVNEAPSPIQPEPNEIFWGGLAFLILFGLMAKFAYPSIKQGMDARTQKIQNDIDSAERAKVESQQVLSDYQRQMANAKAESNRIIEEARAHAEEVRKDLIAKAEAEANELRERNTAELASSKDRLMVDLRGEVTDLAIELAEKVVEKNLDKATNEALIESYISKVGAGK